MNPNTPMGLNVLPGRFAATVAVGAAIVAAIYYPPLVNIHFPAAALGCTLGMIAWLYALARRGHRLGTPALVGLSAAAAFSMYLLWRPFTEIMLRSPFAVVVGAVSIFLYCRTGIRKHAL